MEPPNIAATLAAPGWYPDPTHRFEFRYFNGERWTADVSRNSARYVDPIGGTPPTFSAQPPSPSRGKAVAALVFSLCAVVLAWLPFIFVIGAAGAITALILGTIVLRRSARSKTEGQPIAIGQGMAIAAMCVSVAALALCSVGIYLTRIVWHEFDDLVNPGPHVTQIDSCKRVDGRVVAKGSIRNNDTEVHTYTINIAFRLDGRAWETDGVTVADVAPGQRAQFTNTTDSVDFGSAAPTCTIETVLGPTPFSD